MGKNSCVTPNVAQLLIVSLPRGRGIGGSVPTYAEVRAATRGWAALLVSPGWAPTHSRHELAMRIPPSGADLLRGRAGEAAPGRAALPWGRFSMCAVKRGIASLASSQNCTRGFRGFA